MTRVGQPWSSVWVWPPEMSYDVVAPVRRKSGHIVLDQLRSTAAATLTRLPPSRPPTRGSATRAERGRRWPRTRAQGGVTRRAGLLVAADDGATPHPAPVRRAPRTPSSVVARATSQSSSGREHSYRSRSDSCELTSSSSVMAPLSRRSDTASRTRRVSRDRLRDQGRCDT